MGDLGQLVLVACGAVVTVTGAFAVLGGGFWWLVKPRAVAWAKRELLDPVRETHHSLTVNHHSSEQPTVLDRLDTLTSAVEAQGVEFESLHANVAGLTHVVVEHLRTSSD